MCFYGSVLNWSHVVVDVHTAEEGEHTAALMLDFLGFFSWILEFDKLENISSCLGLFMLCWIFFFILS